MCEEFAAPLKTFIDHAQIVCIILLISYFFLQDKLFFPIGFNLLLFVGWGVIWGWGVGGVREGFKSCYWVQQHNLVTSVFNLFYSLKIVTKNNFKASIEWLQLFFPACVSKLVRFPTTLVATPDCSLFWPRCQTRARTKLS